jgi:hypothetical protein
MMAWIKRIGVLGFAFFLVKGVAWLTVPLVLAAIYGSSGD